MYVLHGERLGIPGETEPEVHGIFHRLEVADIDHPDLAHAVVVAELHLLPGAFHLGDIDPLGVAGCSHIVEVVVHSVAS